MRQRTLKPGFFTNEDLCAMSPLHRLLFAGLWLIADKEGRFENRPARIKVTLFPYEPSMDIAGMLLALESNGFIRLYTAAGSNYGLVTKFAENQNPHPKETASVIPPPVELNCEQVESNLRQSTNGDATGDAIYPKEQKILKEEKIPKETISEAAIRLSREKADDEAADHLNAEVNEEEMHLLRILVRLRDEGKDVQEFCDRIDRPKGQAPFNALRALMSGRSGIPATAAGLTVRRRLIDALEARQRGQESIHLSDSNRETMENIRRAGERIMARQQAQKLKEIAK